MKKHSYNLKIEWTDNSGNGTLSYESYSRNHVVKGENKDELYCSSDPAFRGDPTKYNPEELLLAAIANCHMLWFLHLMVKHKLVVLEYSDSPTGVMIEHDDGSGSFTEVMLNPHIILLCGELNMVEKADITNKILYLHSEANKFCFIANSVNFPISHNPTVVFHLG